MKKILITNWISKIALLSACSVALSSFAHSQTQTPLDFTAFIPDNSRGGTGNFIDSTTGVPFSLTVTSTGQRFLDFNGTGRFVPDHMYISGSGTGTNRITLSFSKDISNFTLHTSDFDVTAERMANFSILPDYADPRFNFDRINNTIRPIVSNLEADISWFSFPPGTREISFDYINGNSTLFVGFAGSVSVPEPSSASLAVLGCLGLILRRKRA